MKDLAILKTTLLAIVVLHASVSQAQTKEYVYEELQHTIESFIDCKVKFRNESYQEELYPLCKTGDSSIIGQRTIISLKIKRKARKEYISINRQDLIEDIDILLVNEGFILACYDADTTTLTYEYTEGSIEESMIEIFLPKNPKSQITITNIDEYNYANQIQDHRQGLITYEELDQLQWCKSSSLILPLRVTRSRTYWVYTGTTVSNNVDEVRLQTFPSTTGWVEKTKDNCKSMNPDDCKIFCLVDFPPQNKRIHVVRDTALTTEFVPKTVSSVVILDGGSNTKSTKSLCKDQIPDSIVILLKEALSLYGYFDGSSNVDVSKELSSSIVKYQKEHNLPVGNYDYQTLVHLLNPE